jgi:PEP-CTERM motif
MFKLSTLAFAALLGLSGAAQAATYNYSGDTTGAPTYNRAFSDFSGLSGLGSAVNYQTLEFTVTATGSYDFVSTASGWDNFLFLYGPSFNPATPLVNGLIANDDLAGTIGSSGFSFSLNAGASYIVVTTGFESGLDFGAYANSITGPGSVNVVPEPGTYGLMALGLAVVGFAARRSRS